MDLSSDSEAPPTESGEVASEYRLRVSRENAATIRPRALAALVSHLGKTFPEQHIPGGGARPKRPVVVIEAEIADLVPAYLAQVKSDVQVAARLVVRRSFDDVRSMAHSWKGSGGSYGFAEITQLGEVIEQACDRQDVSAASDGVEKLRRYLHDVRIVVADASR